MPDEPQQTPEPEGLVDFLTEGEPNVVAEPESRTEPPSPGSVQSVVPQVQTPPQPSDTDRLTQALATIDELRRNQVALEQRLTSVAPRTPERVEPSIEYEEVIGRRIPKDRSKRTIKVTSEDLLRLGWNEDPAATIERLANAFFDFVADVIPQQTQAAWQQRTETERLSRERLNLFWDDHPDLKGMDAFVGTVELGSLNDGSLSPQGLTQKQYNERLGLKVREKVAAMRGLSMDQYLVAVRPTPSGGAAPASRAVTTSGGGGQTRKTGALDPQRKEMDDLIDNR